MPQTIKDLIEKYLNKKHKVGSRGIKNNIVLILSVIDIFTIIGPLLKYIYKPCKKNQNLFEQSDAFERKSRK